MSYYDQPHIGTDGHLYVRSRIAYRYDNGTPVRYYDYDTDHDHNCPCYYDDNFSGTRYDHYNSAPGKWHEGLAADV